MAITWLNIIVTTPPTSAPEELNHLLCSGTDEFRCFDDANDEGLLPQKINYKNKTEIT